MKHILIFLTTVCIISACNTSPELSKEALRGQWECFDYMMEGGSIDAVTREATKELTMKSTQIFSGDTLLIHNNILPLSFLCTFNFDKKTITCSPIGFRDVSARTLSIIDYTGDKLVLQEKIHDITATTYLQRKKN